jgi:hypothetical protein
MSLRFREADVHFLAKLPNLGRANVPVHHGIAVRANSNEVAELLSDRRVFRHISGRRFRGATADAIEFPWFTSPFIFYTTCLKKCRQNMTQNQHGAFVIGGGEPVLDPVTHCIFVNAEQFGDLFNCVVAMDFHEAVVGMTFFHILLYQSIDDNFLAERLESSEMKPISPLLSARHRVS